MCAGGKSWKHVTVNTHRSWLPGDERGFRNRAHRIHSSGDYKRRPPQGEHAGLRVYNEQWSGKPVTFETEVRIIIVRAFVEKMLALGHRVIACSSGENHVHTLCELPSIYRDVRREVGKCKQRASFEAPSRGTIWSEGGMYKDIQDVSHFRNVYDYIRTKQEPERVVWSHRPDEDWIKDPTQGVIMMAPRKRRIRVFASAQTPASE